jgi:hypothetical protein
MTNTDRKECPTCGVQLNLDGTVDELDPSEPAGHYANCDQLEPCICGETTPQDDESGVHYYSEHSDEIVAFACSRACSELIESVRDDWGILTRLSVNELLRRHCPSCWVGLDLDGTVKGGARDVHRPGCTARFAITGTPAEPGNDLLVMRRFNHYGPARDERAQRQAMAGKRIAWRIETIARPQAACDVCGSTGDHEPDCGSGPNR